MQREIVPTSPQYPGALNQPSKSTFKLWSVLVLLSLGILGGVIGGTFAATRLFFTTSDQIQSVFIDTSSTSSSLSQAVNSLTPSLREKIISIINTQGDLMGLGLIATSDGWVVTPHAMNEQEMMLNSRKQKLEISEIHQDTYTGLYFIKLNHSGLPVVTWGKNDGLSSGGFGVITQLSPVQADWVALRTIASLRSDAQTEQFSTHFTSPFQLDTPVNAVAGTPFMATNGQVLGVLTDQQQAVPGWVIDVELSSLIKDGKFRVFPEFSGKSLFYAPGEGQVGFEVTQSAYPHIQVGDVILSVQGKELSKQDQFFEELLSYPVGSTITLHLKRAEQFLDVTISV